MNDRSQELANSTQQPGCHRVSLWRAATVVGAMVVCFQTVFMLTLRTQVKEARRDAASARQLSRQAIERFEAIELVLTKNQVAETVPSVSGRESVFAYPTDQMYRILPDEVR